MNGQLEHVGNHPIPRSPQSPEPGDRGGPVFGSDPRMRMFFVGTCIRYALSFNDA